MSGTRSREAKKHKTLLPIPDKLYFTIGEVSKLCDLKPHVLRYWEQEFTQLSPAKRRGNRRYYQRKDVLLIRQIQSLLYQQGFTIEGARQKLTADQHAGEATTVSAPAQGMSKEWVQNTIQSLEQLVIDIQ